MPVVLVSMPLSAVECLYGSMAVPIAVLQAAQLSSDYAPGALPGKLERSELDLLSAGCWSVLLSFPAKRGKIARLLASHALHQRYTLSESP